MKKLLLLTAAVAALVASSCSRYKYETVAGDPLQTRIYTLPNGLKVYMSVMREQPRIQTAIAVRVGGKNDPAETTGLAHYFEHLMFKGTERFGTSDYEAERPLLDRIEELFEVYRKTADEAERAAIYRLIDSISYEASKIAIPNEYDKLMAAIGANGTNAFTSQDMTVYVEDIPSNRIDEWARIQADRFRHPVIRGFHTELETIYEEKNMSLTQDSRKIWEALDAALFPHHPYGTQTVLGTQEHLKNPSITNVRNYHRTYYVPNNMAVCVAGDFDPDEMIATIDKYFGDMEPNPELPQLEFEPEAPITEPLVREVFGPEAARVMLGWRLPAATDRSNDIAEIVGSILYNGQAGLIDLDLNQQQKVLAASAFTSLQPDYGTFFMAGSPKAGQSLEEVRDLLLAQAAELRAGAFDEELIRAAVDNYKVEAMRLYDQYDERALLFAYTFIDGTDWADRVGQFDRMERITKDDIVAWANEYLGPQNYALVYKREGQDPGEQKIAAPAITPIATNRDVQSDFLTEIQNSEAEPIEPVFVDYDRELARFSVREGIDVLYKRNETNDLFTLVYVFDTGTEDDPALNLAFDYLSYLGTEALTAEQIASQMYALACSFSMRAEADRCSIALTGLSRNLEPAMELVEGLLGGAVADEAILENLKADLRKARADAKLSQGRCFAALQRYLLYGPEFIRRTTLTDAELAAVTSEELLDKIAALRGRCHEVLYYGPQSERQLRAALDAHHRTDEELRPLERRSTPYLPTDESRVVLAQYDAKQLYYLQYADLGQTFDAAADPEIALYNEYFGGNMNSIVFQEMREARGLAYSAWAHILQPAYSDTHYLYRAFIATQNDKMKTAIEAFDEIIEQMPESESAFRIAKEALLARLRTERTVKEQVLWSYLDLRDLGLTEDRDKQLFERVQAMTLDDVRAAQQKWVKGRKYAYGILGDLRDLDRNYLQTLGPVRIVSQEELFGY